MNWIGIIGIKVSLLQYPAAAPPPRRIVFTSMEKFDGVHLRRLTAPEVKQIAGRAGRFGTEFDEGQVTCLNQASSTPSCYYVAPCRMLMLSWSFKVALLQRPSNPTCYVAHPLACMEPGFFRDGSSAVASQPPPAVLGAGLAPTPSSVELWVRPLPRKKTVERW